MNFEEYLKEINIKILNFCKKYNFFHHKDDLLGEAFLCFKKCKEKFEGDEREFKNYFLKSLDNHLLNYLKRETKLILKENKELEMLNEVKNEKFLEDFERILYRLKDEELWIISLIRQGFNLKEISKKLNISYEKVKDIFSEIKSKINPDKRSRKELRRKWLIENEERVKELQSKWRKENSDYFIDWIKKNRDYYKNWRLKNKGYYRYYRLIKNKDFCKILSEFLRFLCPCEDINIEFKNKKEGILMKCNSMCNLKIVLTDKEIEKGKVIVFSRLTSLKNPIKNLKKKRIYLYENPLSNKIKELNKNKFALIIER
ncbi:MAG: sigma-70 family RNA polymerase sigma factor [candidate division WOR-3 bacterium]